MTNPRADTPTIPRPPITSDSFDGPDGPLPAMTDAKLGGKKTAWTSTRDQVALANGKLVPAGAVEAVWSVGVPVAEADVAAEWTLAELPKGTIYLDIRRNANGTEALRAVINGGMMDLRKRLAGGQTGLAPAVPVARGDRVTIGARGNRAYLLKNGAEVASATITEASLLLPGTAGVAGYNDSEWALDDFVIVPV